MAIDTCPTCGRVMKNVVTVRTGKKRGDCSKHGRTDVRVVGPRGHISGPMAAWPKKLPTKGSNDG